MSQNKITVSTTSNKIIVTETTNEIKVISGEPSPKILTATPIGIQGPPGEKGETGSIGNFSGSFVESIRGLTGIVGVCGGKGISVTTTGKTFTIASTLSLSELGDVNLSSSQPREALVYQQSGRWTNERVSPLSYFGGTKPTSGATVGDFWLDTDTGRYYTFFNDGSGIKWIELPYQ